MSYNSEHTGEQVDGLLKKAGLMNVVAEDVGEGVEAPEITYVTKGEMDSAISQAITTTLNTEV